MYENRRYLIIPVTELSKVDFNQVGETSLDTVRKSVDGTKTFVKYDVIVIDENYDTEVINPETNEPEIFTTLAGVYGRPSFYSDEYLELTHSEILEVLNTSEWVNETNIIE